MTYFLSSFTPGIVLRNAHTLRDGFLIRDAVIERSITYRITQFLDLFLSGQVEDCTRFEHGKEDRPGDTTFHGGHFFDDFLKEPRRGEGVWFAGERRNQQKICSGDSGPSRGSYPSTSINDDPFVFGFEACNLSVQIGSRQTNNGHRREMSWAIPLPIKGRLLGISINQEHIRAVAGE